MMKKHYLLAVAFFFHFILSYCQTIEDVKKLGLTDEQLRVSFERRQLQLINNSTKKIKIVKEGSFATIKMKGDTTKNAFVIEAFLSDTIIVSSSIPQLEDEEIKLGFAEFKLLPIKDIESIEYSLKHVNRAFWAGFLMSLTGLEMAVLPVAMPLIIGNYKEIYSQLQFPFIVIGGVVL